MRATPVAAACAVSAAILALLILRRDRWSAVRKHRWAFVRNIYHDCATREFARRIEAAAAALDDPRDALNAFPGCDALLEEILGAQSFRTYQSKATNLVQIASLVERVSDLLPALERVGVPQVLDLVRMEAEAAGDV